jgi:class 3 adenylate cyclase
MLRNILAPALGLALRTNAALTAQDQMASPAGLWEISPGAENITVWFSNITDTIYSQDATNFDYQLLGDGKMRDFDAAIESVEHFAQVFAGGDADAVLVAFSNHSMLGRLSAEEAANKEWLCRELDCLMNKVAEACEDVEAPCSVRERIKL